ncbi:MAG TPA: phosphate ABC transporter substrate-binding protein [Candidatus Limnocylindria bacterium]|nr:phosphate ABC transporter substrate-binding protein [Candidatus Limnocylindria bacterium]
MLIRRVERRQRATGLAGIALFLAIASCGVATPPTPTPEPLSGTYTASGGGGALPAVQALTARFKELHPGVNWIVAESGSNSAIKLVVADAVDVGFVSRSLTDLEKQQVTGIPIGFSGTAVVVNAANPLTNLSKEQIRQIYTGEVTNWLELGWLEPTIRPYIREPNAATRQTFEAFVFGGSLATYGKNVIQQTEVEAMLTAVNSFRGAIGIASTGSRTAADTRVRMINIDGVAATQENIASGAYKIVRPLAVIYSNTGELKPAVRAFFEFVKSPEGQRIAAGAF